MFSSSSNLANSATVISGALPSPRTSSIQKRDNHSERLQRPRSTITNMKPARIELTTHPFLVAMFCQLAYQVLSNPSNNWPLSWVSIAEGTFHHHANSLAVSDCILLDVVCMYYVSVVACKKKKRSTKARWWKKNRVLVRTRYSVIELMSPVATQSVSYTHLTLPTIPLV